MPYIIIEMIAPLGGELYYLFFDRMRHYKLNSGKSNKNCLIRNVKNACTDILY
jgi:hypothetical protein